MQSLYIENREIQKWIAMNELLYITTEKKDHKLKIVTETDNYSISGTLSLIEKKHPTLFRCRRNVLVNLYAIKEIDKNTRTIKFIQDDAFNCQVSRRIYGDLCSKVRELYDS